MSQHNVKILCQNVCGLNAPAHRTTVRKIVDDSNCTTVCLQESKLANVDDTIIREVLWPKFVDQYAFLPTAGTRGGIIIAASSGSFEMSHPTSTTNTLTVTIHMKNEGPHWFFTGVYAPGRL